MEGSIWLWTVLNLFLLGTLALDPVIFHRKSLYARQISVDLECHLDLPGSTFQRRYLFLQAQNHAEQQLYQ